MARLMNGETSFIHPVSGVRVGPFEFYEGYAHTEDEATRVIPEGEDAEEVFVEAGDQELTPAEKAAITRAANKAAKEAEEAERLAAEEAAKKAGEQDGDAGTNTDGAVSENNPNPSEGQS